MIRLSVTDLDSYLYFLRAEEMTFEQLLARLRGEEPPKPSMLAGRAFHSALEHASDGTVDQLRLDGYTFTFQVDAELPLPSIRELKGELRIATSSGPVTLVGKVDALEGRTVRDYKLTERFDAERYADSYQWRAYLMMFEAERFVYDVFQARYDRNDDHLVTIHDYQRLAWPRYGDLEHDVRSAVDGLAEIVARHVPQKIMAEAA